MLKHGDGWWILGGLAPSIALLCVSIAKFGSAAPGIVFALQGTARWAYLLFWGAYAGSALVAMCGTAFAMLVRHRRELGLSFASAMVPHSALVIWILVVSRTSPMAPLKLVFFSIALFLTFLLAALSFRQISDKCSPKLLRSIRFWGSEYIALAFLRDFIRLPLHGTLMEWVSYLPFTCLAAAAVLLRLSKLLADRRRMSRLEAHA